MSISPKIQALADRVGVKIAHRSCQDDHIFDGKTIATYGSMGLFRDHDLLHEIMHYFVAAPEQRNLPEYGLGATFTFGSKDCNSVVDLEEATIQEFMAQFLCIKWGKDLDILPTLCGSEDFPQSWNHYLEYKTSDGETNVSCWRTLKWKVLFRLERMGLLL